MEQDFENLNVVFKEPLSFLHKQRNHVRLLLVLEQFSIRLHNEILHFGVCDALAYVWKEKTRHQIPPIFLDQVSHCEVLLEDLLGLV